MVETNITRRRVLQGAGAIGIASFGGTVVSAQEEGGQDGPGAAIRVVHASPDAPNVDVRLNSADGGGTAGDGNQTGGGNQTNETGGGQGGDSGSQIGGLGFRSVSSYNEVEPGSYQIQIVPAEGGLIEGFIEDLFGGGDDDERTVLFEDQIDVEQGTAYTVVAFGEVAQGPIPVEGAEMAGNETDGTGANETVGNETADDGTVGNETAGNVTADDETVGNETAGNATADDDTNAGGVETSGAGEQLVSELAFGEHETVDVDAGDYMLAFRRAGAAGMAGDTGGGPGGNETDGAGTIETNDTAGNETDGGFGVNETNDTAGGEPSAEAGGAGRAFQVKILEDDVTDPGQESARLRVFHAVPDVETMSISRLTEQGGAGGAGTPAANGTGGGVGQNDTGGGIGENDTGGGVGQNDTGGVGGQQENGTVGGGAGQQQGGNGRQAQFSAEANTAYSGFAMGYFDPQAAASAGEQGGAGNVTGGNVTGGNATDDGNATGNATSGEEVAEDAGGEEFEFVTVQDAQGGQRSDGGTGGLFRLAPPADD